MSALVSFIEVFGQLHKHLLAIEKVFLSEAVRCLLDLIAQNRLQDEHVDRPAYLGDHIQDGDGRRQPFAYRAFFTPQLKLKIDALSHLAPKLKDPIKIEEWDK